MNPASRRTRAADPGRACRDLRRLAAAGQLPRLLLLVPPARGEEEPWFAEQVLGAARGWARSQAGLDVLELDGGSPDFQPEVLESFLGASSLFGGGRALLLGRAAKALNRWPRLVPALGRAVADPSGPRWMVVQTEKPGKKAQAELAGLAKAHARDGAVVQQAFRRLYGDPPPWDPDPDRSEAARFAAAEAQERGMRLLRGAAGLMVQVAGAGPGELVQALEHFQLLGLMEIDEEQVRRVAAHSAEGNALEYAEAVLSGDGPAALRCLQHLRARGLRTWSGRRLATQEAFGLVLAALARERRRTAAVAYALAGGSSFTEACKVAGVAATGPPGQRLQRRLERCGREQLQRVLSGLRRSERMVKVQGCRDAGQVLEWLALHAHRSRSAAEARR